MLMNKLGKKLSIVSLVLSVAYIAFFSFMLMRMASGAYDNITAEAVSQGMQTTMPHFITVIIGAILNAAAVFYDSAWFVLSATLFYTISMLLFPFYFIFVLLPIILSCLAFFILYTEKKKASESFLKKEED